MADDHTWRVGRSVGRTIYINDELVGLMDTPELAARVVAAVEGFDAALEMIRRLRDGWVWGEEFGPDDEETCWLYPANPFGEYEHEEPMTLNQRALLDLLVDGGGDG